MGMRRAIQWIGYTSGLVLAALVGSGLSLAVEYRQAKSSLTADLQGSTWAAQSADFDGRLRRSFPQGTPESHLINALKAEDFHPDWSSSYNEHQAVRREDSFVCSVGAYAIWQVDRESKLTAVRGVYQEEGCS
jgi:hypothetical protein